MNAILEGKTIPELNAIIEEAKNAKEKKTQDGSEGCL